MMIAVCLMLVSLCYTSSIKMEMTKIKINNKQIHSLAQLSSSWEYDEFKKNSGWNGTFDNKISLASTTNSQGAIYVGQLFISDQSQPLRVIFDTGSDYLAITSSLCSSKTFGPKFKNSIKSDEIHIDKIEFDGIEKMSWNNGDQEVKDHTAVQQKLESSLVQLRDSDDYKTEVMVQAPLKEEKKVLKEETWGPPTPRCNTEAYSLA